MQKDQRALTSFFRNLTTRLVIFVRFAAGVGGVFAFGRSAQAQLQGSVKNVQQTAQAAGVVGGGDLIKIIGRIINVFLGTLGVVFLVLLLIAGYFWMTAGGDEAKIKKAKAYIRNAVIGLVIIVSAFAIVNFILKALADETGGGGITSKSQGGMGALVVSSGSLGNGIIEYHLPERNATNIPRNTPVIITFKQPIQPASFIQGWTEATSFTAKGLNADNIQIFKTGNEGTALKTSEANVFYTKDRKTFVIRPVQPLGNAVSNVKYLVRLKGGNSGILLEAGGAAFSGSFSQGYEWGFEVSTFLDKTPPNVLAAVPYAGGKYARNVVIQITFNEAVDPTGASGIFKNGGGFSNIQVRPNDGEGAPLEGEFRITNQYRTVEFLTFEKCGVNSCGKDVFCLPADATLETTVKAATLSDQPPLAQLTDQGFDGITDVVGNSLDGNDNDTAEGAPTDNFVWSFGTSNQIKLNPPKIIATIPDASPGQGQSNRPLDETITATFDDLMQASTFTSEAAYIEPKGPGEKDPDTFWWTVGMNLLNEKNQLLKPGEKAVRGQLSMKHRPYVPSGLLPQELNYYNPHLLSDLQDAYQNCFNPAASINEFKPAQSCAGPNCCNNSFKKQACLFTP